MGDPAASHEGAKATRILDFGNRVRPLKISAYRLSCSARQCLSIRSIDSGLHQSQDNFLLLRLFAACLVIYRHAGAVTGGKGFWDIIPWLGWGTDSGKMATEAFFIVSGFMITGSFLRRQHLPSFLWARFLRIVPAYLCCLVFTSLVLGAALTTHPLSNYFSDSRVADYIIKNISFSTHMAWHLPGVFTENPKTQTINGSIWTLPAEVRMYLWVALLGFTGVLAKRWYATALIATLFIAGYASRYDLVMLPAIYAQMGAMFALGSLCYLHRSIIPSGWPCAAFLVIITFLSNKTAAYPYLFDLSLVQVCFCIAYFTPWYGFNRFGDYSYGVYIWGFPVQQTIAHFYPLLSPLDNAISALPITLALGAMSWYLVESPALKLKRTPSVFRKNVLKRQTHTE